jgi:NADPH-dependent 2,4-dienoyl-CoA reductase/sulfur reductase-like enzyme
MPDPGDPPRRVNATRRIVVVGASLPGLRAAEALRERGFDGELALVGDEPHKPYNRPPLSKTLLLGDDTPASCALHTTLELDAEWHLTRRAEQLELGARRVVLDDSESLRFDGLVIATGARARSWPDGPAPAGVSTLRDIDDAVALREALERQPRRVLVVGGGFIGGEVASSAAALGLPVTLVEREPAPLAGVLGREVSAFLADLHRTNGVDVRVGTIVERFLADASGLRGALLSDGGRVDADVCLLALRTSPNTEWLQDARVKLDRGVACSADLHVSGPRAVVAAGDVARWPHPMFDDELISVGHWTNALEQGVHAAHNLLASPHESEPFASVPTFWTD